ncbi:MAG: phage antirepressor KilAC domain-containing protein [Cetobacterium sp.]
MLIKIENKNGIINSLELLEQINFFRKQESDKTELRHDNLRSIIKDEFEEEILSLKIQEKPINSNGGRPSMAYELTPSQAKQVLVRESKFVRKAVIKMLEELEQKVNQKVPTNFKEALLLALEQQEKIEALQVEMQVKEQVIQEYKPKIEYLDTILKSQDTMTVTQIAADYGISAKRLNQILHEEKIQRKVGGQWLLYTNHMNNGYTKSETTEIRLEDGKSKVVINTKWSQKGRIKIHEILSKLGIMANMDKEKCA